MIDSHLHTRFSHDSVEDLLNYAKKAVSDGFSYIAVTDHIDMDFCFGIDKPLNYDGYFNAIEYARLKYPGVTIAAGIEIGYTKDYEAENKAFIEKYPFETVINSVHSVNGEDCYFAESFRGKERNDIYKAYFETVLQSLYAPHYFSHLGHLGYVMRNAPFKNRLAEFKEFEDILSEIFKTMIEKNIILELNTSVCGTGTLTVPYENLLKAYYDIGGRLVTFSSDAHIASRMGYKYSETVEMAKKIGFTDFAVVHNRAIELIKI